MLSVELRPIDELGDVRRTLETILLPTDHDVSPEGLSSMPSIRIVSIAEHFAVSLSRRPRVRQSPGYDELSVGVGRARGRSDQSMSNFMKRLFFFSSFFSGAPLAGAPLVATALAAPFWGTPLAGAAPFTGAPFATAAAFCA